MKALSISLVLVTSLLAANSYAGDRQFAGTLIGGAIGATVGNHVGGTNGAIIGGVAGAYIGSEATRRESRRDVVYVRESRPYHHKPRRDTIIYEDSPRVYYSQPAYYAPAPGISERFVIMAGVITEAIITIMI